jgi:dTDP-glucose 4,6-dehydratase
VDDHAAGVLAVLAKGELGGIYHLGSGVESRNLDLVHRVCDELTQCAPGPDYRALISHVTDRLGHDFRYALDVEPTREALGFAARIGFAEGLRATVRWYVEHPQWTATMLAHKQAVA